MASLNSLGFRELQEIPEIPGMFLKPISFNQLEELEQLENTARESQDSFEQAWVFVHWLGQNALCDSSGEKFDELLDRELCRQSLPVAKLRELIELVNSKILGN